MQSARRRGRSSWLGATRSPRTAAIFAFGIDPPLGSLMVALLRWLGAAILLSIPVTSTAAGDREEVAAGPPNILFFLADDLGWADVGYHDPNVETPNLDRLAGEGVRLEQHYSSPRCTPSRVALLTGRTPGRFGSVTWTSLLAIPLGTRTLANVLSDVGYHTAIAGKWHISSRADGGPNHFGFDESYGCLSGGVDPYTHFDKGGAKKSTWHRDHTFITEEGHATDLIASEVLGWIDEAPRPFFFYVPFTAVHVPLKEPDRWKAIYEGKVENAVRREYLAAVSHMDDAIGRILARLEEKGELENTIVVFASDNGAQPSIRLFAEGYDAYGADPDLGSNLPFRGWKGELYEGGIRVPAIVSWKGRLEPRVVRRFVTLEDWLPTLAGRAGVKTDALPAVDGRDVWPIFEGGRVRRNYMFWRTPEASAIRAKQWKLIKSEGDEIELFDIAKDPYETKDVSSQRPYLVRQLLDLLRNRESQDPPPKLFTPPSLEMLRSLKGS